jgi:hypothetical protein
MASEKSRGSDRTRNWAVVVYPESAPENWRELIDEQHIEWVESPLHEFDVNPTGELKKPHWHLLLMFGGVKSFEQVCDFIKPLNCPIPQRCHNAKAAVRYMAHLDNPDKFQYDVGEIKAHGGVDLAELLRPSSSERYTLIDEMAEFVKQENIMEFQDLFDFARKEKRDTWFPLLCDNSAYVIGQYIKSQRHRQEIVKR